MCWSCVVMSVVSRWSIVRLNLMCHLPAKECGTTWRQREGGHECKLMCGAIEGVEHNKAEEGGMDLF